MATRYTTQPGGFYGGGVGNEATVIPQAVRFDPSQLPGTPPLGLPMAMGIFGAGNIAGFSGQDIPPGYMNKIVS